MAINLPELAEFERDYIQLLSLLDAIEGNAEHWTREADIGCQIFDRAKQAVFGFDYGKIEKLDLIYTQLCTLTKDSIMSYISQNEQHLRAAIWKDLREGKKDEMYAVTHPKYDWEADAKERLKVCADYLQRLDCDSFAFRKFSINDLDTVRARLAQLKAIILTKTATTEIDTIPLSVAITEFQVSRATLKRKIEIGKIKSYRRPGAARNSALRVSRKELESQFLKR